MQFLLFQFVLFLSDLLVPDGLDHLLENQTALPFHDLINDGLQVDLRVDGIHLHCDLIGRDCQRDDGQFYHAED